MRAFIPVLAALLIAPFPSTAAVLNSIMPSAPAAPVFIPPVLLAPAALTANSASPLAFAPALPSASLTVPALAPMTAAPAALVALNAASADGVEPAPVAPSEPAREPVAENAAANAGARFDGSAEAASAAPVTAPPAPAVASAPLGSGLRMARSEQDIWLAPVVELLAGTRTGRRVLRDVDRLTAREGRPVLIEIKHIGNNGEFRYDSEMLIMDLGHLKRDPAQSAPILAHELQHVLQRAMELPVDVLEMEIESYTVENRLWNELGVEPEPDTFSRRARAQILKGAPGFVKWLGGEYTNNIPLYGTTIDAYVALLEKNLAAAKRLRAKNRRARAAVERVLESMRANGMPEEAIAAHRRDDLEPLDRRLRDGDVYRGWIERDLRLLSEPAARARFRAYARGVIRRASSLSRP